MSVKQCLNVFKKPEYIMFLKRYLQKILKTPRERFHFYYFLGCIDKFLQTFKTATSFKSFKNILAYIFITKK